MSNSLSERVAEEIRAMLARRRVSGRELARRLGVSSPWVSNRLTGHLEIGLDELQRIADALEVEVADLLPRPVYRDGRRTGEGGIMWPSSHAPATPATASYPAHTVPPVRPRTPTQPATGHDPAPASTRHRVDTRRTARQRQGRPTWTTGGVTT